MHRKRSIRHPTSWVPETSPLDHLSPRHVIYTYTTLSASTTSSSHFPFFCVAVIRTLNGGVLRLIFPTPGSTTYARTARSFGSSLDSSIGISIYAIWDYISGFPTHLIFHPCHASHLDFGLSISHPIQRNTVIALPYWVRVPTLRCE